MAAPGPLDPSGFRVPLRRLSTKRFKTLQARREDAARRRLIYTLGKEPDNYSFTREDAREARRNGVSWSELAAVAAEQRRLNRLWLDADEGDVGDPLHSRRVGRTQEGLRFWQARDTTGRIPESFYFYHGLFG